MRRIEQCLVGAFVLVCCAVGNAKETRPAVEAGKQPLAGELQATVREGAFVGVPLVLDVTLKNTGKETLWYWCGGPEDFPMAEHFSVTVTDAQGKSRKVLPTNGQFELGSGYGREIAPGDSKKLPLAIGPLEAGTWKLQVQCEEKSRLSEKGEKLVEWPAMGPVSVTVTVKEDQQGRANWEKELLKTIRSGKDAFARHLASEYGGPAVIDALLTDIASTDATVAMAAMQTVFRVSMLPKGTAKAVKEAVSKQLAREEGKTDVGFLAHLMAYTMREPSDEMLEAVLAVAHCTVTSPGNELRYHAVAALRNFPQEKSQQALRGFLTDGNERVRETAKNSLDNPWPPKAPTATAPAPKK